MCGNWGLFIKSPRRKRSGRRDGVDLENCAYLGQISRSVINYRVMRFRAKNFFSSALQVDWIRNIRKIEYSLNL